MKFRISNEKDAASEFEASTVAEFRAGVQAAWAELVNARGWRYLHVMGRDEWLTINPQGRGASYPGTSIKTPLVSTEDAEKHLDNAAKALGHDEGLAGLLAFTVAGGEGLKLVDVEGDNS